MHAVDSIVCHFENFAPLSDWLAEKGPDVLLLTYNALDDDNSKLRTQVEFDLSAPGSHAPKRA